MDESITGDSKELRGRFVNLFDADLRVFDVVKLAPGSRFFLLDLEVAQAQRPRILASACKTLVSKQDGQSLVMTVEGIARTSAVILLQAQRTPRTITLAGQPLKDFDYSSSNQLLWIRFPNEARPRELSVQF